MAMRRILHRMHSIFWEVFNVRRAVQCLHLSNVETENGQSTPYIPLSVLCLSFTYTAGLRRAGGMAECAVELTH